MVISDLTWLECRVKPLRQQNAPLLMLYETILNGPDFERLDLPTPTFGRAADIRAVHGYSLADSLHLGAAVEAGCGAFLTNDARLAGFGALGVEVLP